MVSRREGFLFSDWWDMLMSVDTSYKSNPAWYHDRYKNLEYRKIEELSFDLLSKVRRIEHIPNSIFGETYTRLSDMSAAERELIQFHHYHIYPQLKQYNWIQDIKEWNKYSN